MCVDSLMHCHDLQIRDKNHGKWQKKVMPLELKTGKASFSMEHKGQVWYLITSLLINTMINCLYTSWDVHAETYNGWTLTST